MRHSRLLSFLSLAPLAAVLASSACEAPAPAPPAVGKNEPVGTYRGALWPQIQPIVTPPFPVAGLRFGDAIDNSGARFIVGAPTVGDQNTYPLTSDTRAGQAIVYHRAPTSPTYAFEDLLVAVDGAEWDEFGKSVAIDRLVVPAEVDGGAPTVIDRAAVGAIRAVRQPTVCTDFGRNTPNVRCNSGAVYVFERNTTTNKWAQVARLWPSDIAADMYFGKEVALDGDRLVTSAYKSDFGFNDAGTVYVFDRQQDGTWLETARIEASDKDSNDQFGVDVDVAGDQIVVGAFLDDDLAKDSGAVYVYERQGDGTWLERPKLRASDGCREDRLGTTVTIEPNRIIAAARDYEDGRTGCVVPNPPDGGLPTLDTGAAYVFERQGDGTWVETAKIVPPDPTLNLRFGANLDLSGTTAVIGTFNDLELGINVGSAYVYQFAAGAWTLDLELHPLQPFDNLAFGTKVSIDGTQIAIGAYKYETAEHPHELGAAYVFEHAAGVQDGAACINNNDQYCLSGFCADGVCCNARCGGTCESCLGTATGATDGVCAAIPDDTDPDDECATDDVSTCLRDGTCDGARACRAFYVAGTPCGETACTGDAQGGTQTGRSCNGGGTCGDIPVACGNYLCTADETACRTDCAANAECAAFAFCDLATDTCVPKRAQGETCGSNAECGSDRCVDGVCCNEVCGNPCEACNISAELRGTCSAVPDGQPQGGRDACSSGYVCEGRACVPAVRTCNEERTKTFDPATGVETDCELYRCTNGECETRCTSSASCQFGSVCNRETSRCIRAVELPASVPVGCSVAGPRAPDGSAGSSGGAGALVALVGLGAALRLRRRRAAARL